MNQNQNFSDQNPEIIEPGIENTQKKSEILSVPEKPLAENQGSSVVVEQPIVNIPSQTLPSQKPLNTTAQTQPQKDLVYNDADNLDKAEKPWIKEAESIIEKGRNQPFKEEEDHENLEIKYMKERFGKTIKKSED